MRKLPSYGPTLLRTSKGFTLVELVIYVGLTTIVIGLFGGILITVVRIQSQQTSSRQVGEELAFAMNVIKRDIRDSSYISTHDTWMSLITPSSSGEIIIDTASGIIRKQETAGGDFLPLTTNKVTVSALSLTTLSQGSSKAVKISITMSFNTSNPQQQYTQTLQATAAPLKKTD